MTKISLPILPERKCGNCQKCCEGWLEADIYGNKMQAGQPCFYLEKGEGGCSIYENRPKDPCIDYKCAWLEEPGTFPAWLKPNLSNVIITKKTIEDTDISYYQAVEAGSKMDASVLHWFMMFALRTGTCIMYEIEGKSHTLASPQFDAAYNAAVQRKKNS